jgi:hypothetical protein
MSKKEDDLLKEHDLAKKLAKHGGTGGIMRLKGYIGSSDSPDSVCLYLNLDFDECLYIKKSDIIHVEEAPDGELEFGGVYIWVRKDAEMTHVKTSSVKDKASFLEGDIARAQLKPSAAAAISGQQVIPTPPITIRSCGIVQCGPSVFIPCRTVDDFACPEPTEIPRFCWPSHFRPCPTDPRIDCVPSHIVPCRTTGPTILPCCEPSIVARLCGPSVLDPCPSIREPICRTLADCPTQPVLCAASGGIQCGGPTVNCPDPTTVLTEQIKELVDQMKTQNARLKKLSEKEGTGTG